MRTRVISAIILASIGLCSCTKTDEDYARARDYKEFSCPPPGLEEFGSWGKSGRMRRCVIRNGSFVASEGDTFFAGQYKDGKQVGIWRWYDRAGKVSKEVDYSHEQEGTP